MLQTLILPGLLNAVFPPRCPACHAPTEAPHSLCAACFSEIHFITAPACARCGHPFEYAMGEGALCGECLREDPPFDGVWSALRYDEHSKALITRLKYADRTDLAPFCARLMARGAEGVLSGADYLVPVPLHWRRMVMRRFNQSHLLAKEVSRPSGIPVLPDALRRVRYTPPQAGLTRAEREKNLQGAFKLNPKHTPLLEGKTLVLVDDVMTTGTTVKTCVKTLRKSHPARIHVLTLARRVLVD